MKGYITFEDKGGKRSTSKISDITSLEALGTLATSLDSFSNAKIISYGVMLKSSFAGTLQEGAYGSIEDKARFSFVDQSDADDPATRSLNIPAPDDDILEFINGVGRRVKKSQGDALAAMLSTATGHTIVYSKGHFRAKMTQSQI